MYIKFSASQEKEIYSIDNNKEYLLIMLPHCDRHLLGLSLVICLALGAMVNVVKQSAQLCSLPSPVPSYYP